MPSRTDGVDNVFAWQVISSCNLSFSYLASAKSPAFFKQFRSCSKMYCSINTTSAEKRFIGSIYDSFDISLLSYIALYCSNYYVLNPILSYKTCKSDCFNQLFSRKTNGTPCRNQSWRRKDLRRLSCVWRLMLSSCGNAL